MSSNGGFVPDIDVLYTTRRIWWQFMNTTFFLSFHNCIIFISWFSSSCYSSVLCQIYEKQHGNIAHSAQRKQHCTNGLHPHFPKNAMDMFPMGEKAVCPASCRRTALFKGFPKTAMRSELHGGKLVWKMRKKTFKLQKGGKKSPGWARRLPINVNEGLSQKDFFPSLNMKQEVSC